MPLPTGFVAVQDATTAGAIVSLIGLVISVDEPRKTKGTDWALGFAIQGDFSTGSVGSACSINCRMFNKQPDKLPKLTVGDVVILRKFKLNAWNFRIDCVGDSRLACGVLVFPGKKIPVPELRLPYQSGKQVLPFAPTPGTRDPTIQEQMAVIDMKHASSGSGQDVQQHASAIAFKSTGKRSLTLIKDLRENIFSDVRAQIVNLYYSAVGVELKVTDYTANSQLFLYADPEQDSDLVVHRTWPGPYGQLTLDVRLYEPHARWARDNLNNGDYIFMRNLHARISPAGKLEGVIHEDRMHPNQVDISKLVNPVDIAEIDQRRRLYEKQRSPKGLMLRDNAPTTTSGKISALKKQEKRGKMRLERELELKQLEDMVKDSDAERNGINTNIRAGFPETTSSTLSEILINPHLETETAKYNLCTLPFVNCKHRTRVRVVDFFPPEIEYFAHSTTDPGWGVRAKKHDSGGGRSIEKWEWGFVLLVEDAHVPLNTVAQQLRVVVGNKEAEGLLKMNAANLRTDPKVLSRLEERLFILWGNLFEVKSELRARGSDLPLPPGDNRLQNKPFDCVIEEYGHEVLVSEDNPEGWQRMHKLAHTTIML